MTSSNKAELRVSYAHDPKVMGYTRVHATVHRDNALPAPAFSWGPENGVLSRSQLVGTIIHLVQDIAPSRVGFRADLPSGDLPEEFNYWSPKTLRDVINGTKTAADLLVV